MKTKPETKEKDFDTVKIFRTIKEKISKDIINMNVKEIKVYLKNKKPRLQIDRLCTTFVLTNKKVSKAP